MLKELQPSGIFFLKVDPPDVRLSKLVDKYNSQAHSEATTLLFFTMDLWKQEIMLILKEYPELGPIKLLQYETK